MNSSTARRCIWGAAIGGLMLLVWDLAAELGLPEVDMTIPIRIHELALVGIVLCILIGSGWIDSEKRSDSLMAQIGVLQRDVDEMRSNIEALIRRDYTDPLSLNDPRYDSVRAHIDSLDDRKKLL